MILWYRFSRTVIYWYIIRIIYCGTFGIFLPIDRLLLLTLTYVDFFVNPCRCPFIIHLASFVAKLISWHKTFSTIPIGCLCRIRPSGWNFDTGYRVSIHWKEECLPFCKAPKPSMGTRAEEGRISSIKSFRVCVFPFPFSRTRRKVSTTFSLFINITLSIFRLVNLI